ncbi:hypothetical protein [Flavobacterium sp. J27]|uniref:hypothetical protein n=1 Tax=Flavobacterium sp. J27 TaxID=2060419 RepID=UPI001031A4C6|nr:hypothetical protein [Flavobacterium sp. J27]
MKKFLVFILLLINNFYSFSCGFYPYGEEIRMYFLNPSHFNCSTFNGFHYSSKSFSLEYPYAKNEIAPNDQLWFNYCLGRVPIQAIEDAVYTIPIELFNERNQNKMIQFLYESKDLDAINYLKFAKSCEAGNMYLNDPWERNAVFEKDKMINKINEAIFFSNNVKNKELAFRYQFLAIRLAFYAGERTKVISIFESLPQLNKPTILDYWCLYFRTLVEENKALQSFYAAQVFANAPEKRFAIHRSFDKKLPLEVILKYAKNDEEKANVYALAAMKKVDKSLDYIKKAFELNSNAIFNTFILIREINKIEDWVFTPYYTTFFPSLEKNPFQWDDNLKFSYSILEKRIQSDRLYAKEVLQFLNSLPFKNPQIEVCKAHLAFISKEYQECNKIIANVENQIQKDEKLTSELQLIKALNEIVSQKNGNATISKDIQEILLQNKDNDRFLFAIARELEFLGNTTDAAFLLSKINYNSNFEEGYYNGSFLTWKSRAHKKGSYRDYFDDYFGYLDIIYTPQQLEVIIKTASENNTNSIFINWMKDRIIKEMPKLYDLLGTKYIRQNNLEKALACFQKIDEKYWITNYSLWGDDYIAYDKIFDKNPFFTFKNTPEFIPEKEDFYLTKKSVTERLIYYLEKANNPNESERDFYYFLVANCYRNMIKYGNVWMMRRFGTSSYDVAPFPEDEAEFQNGYLSKKYYKLAYKYSNSEKFKALCLWLAEDYKQLKNKFENEYYDLSDRNCTAFEDYFNSRK